MNKARIKELTAGDIQEIAKTELELRGCLVWRQNQIPQRFRKFRGKKGQSDLVGISKQGLFVGCEAKTLKDRLSKEQIEFLTEVKQRGGIALIAIQDKHTGQFCMIEFKND